MMAGRQVVRKWRDYDVGVGVRSTIRRSTTNTQHQHQHQPFISIHILFTSLHPPSPSNKNPPPPEQQPLIPLTSISSIMGGDDLASDDEFLFDSGLIGNSGGRGRNVDVSSADENGSVSEGDDGISSRPSLASNKRQGADEFSTSKKRRKKNSASSSSKDILLHVGRGIAMDDVDAQAMFLGTLFSHSIKMSEGSGSGGGGDETTSEEKKESFQFQPHLYAASTDTNETTKQFQHTNLAAFLRAGPLPSNKRLKNWKHPHSPMILIVTLSARRSVELMKQLSSMKLPIAKLFAKHMNVEDQVELLSGVGNSSGGGGGGGGGGKKKGNGRCYSLAVGTPGRLLKLLRHGSDGDRDPRLEQGALRLNHTELVVLDCHEDSKGWNVCTLKDTSTELMDLMKDGVIPQLEKRKGKIKLALF